MLLLPLLLLLLPALLLPLSKWVSEPAEGPVCRQRANKTTTTSPTHAHGCDSLLLHCILELLHLLLLQVRQRGCLLVVLLLQHSSL